MMDDFSVGPFCRIFILACATACCCVLSTKTLAGELGKAALSEKPIEVLGGRLTVRMPQGAKIEARLFNIMSSPESEEHETRIAFDAGQERLVLIVHEDFAFAGDDFEKDVREWVAKWRGKYRIEPIQLPTKGLKAGFTHHNRIAWKHRKTLRLCLVLYSMVRVKHGEFDFLG